MLMEDVLHAVLLSSMCPLLKHAKSMDVLAILLVGVKNVVLDILCFIIAANCLTV